MMVWRVGSHAELPKFEDGQIVSCNKKLVCVFELEEVDVAEGVAGDDELEGRGNGAAIPSAVAAKRDENFAGFPVPPLHRVVLRRRNSETAQCQSVSSPRYLQDLASGHDSIKTQASSSAYWLKLHTFFDGFGQGLFELDHTSSSPWCKSGFVGKNV